MVSAVEEIISDEDPQGKVLHEYAHPNGMLVQNKVVPFGNILIIYESRPDVTIEAAITAFKGGNKILLKGGKEVQWSIASRITIGWFTLPIIAAIISMILLFILQNICIVK